MIFMSYQAWGADCYTTADNTWSCGTPISSDNLIVTHTVTINGNWTSTGNITIRNGGRLIISGNLTGNGNTITIEDGTLNVGGNVVLNSNSTLNVYGLFDTGSSLTVRSGATFYLKGAGTINGNTVIDAGSTFLMKKESDLLVIGDLTNNANTTEVDGVLTIEQTLINNSLITGVGEISFNSCLEGSGIINDLNSATYCSSSPIDMLSSHCSDTDTEPPTFTTFPANIITYATKDECEMIVSWSGPQIDDNCSVDDTISTSTSGDLFSIGITDVKYTLSDKADNIAQKTFTINVVDTISPVITGLPNIISIDAELSTCGASVSWSEPTATDNCSAILTSDYNPGDFFAIGTYTVTYAATDPSGNTTLRSFDIEVTNPHKPVFTSCPIDTVLYTGQDNCEIAVNWDEPVAEGCGINVSQSHKPGDMFAIGAHEVNYTATDVSGNMVSCIFQVVVLDTIAPVFIFCPTTSEMESIDEINNTAVITWDEPKAEDQCSLVSMQSSHQSGDSFPFGSTPVTYTATDEFGNEAICTFDVQAGINNPPTVESQSLTIQAGEEIDICLRASDPDGDQVSIHSIHSNENNAIISDVDSSRLCFVYSSFSDFKGTDTLIVEVVDGGLPNMYAKAEVLIKVERDHNVFPASAITPNGDEINDQWIITNIDLYPNNYVRIVDRWGGVIYQNSGYDNISNVWEGKNEAGRFVSSGTYFFVIDLGSDGDKITGPIEVIE